MLYRNNNSKGGRKMPINVKDNKGNHLGYIHGCLMEFRKCFLLAISDYVVEDYNLNFGKIDRIIAKVNGLTTWNGKIKEQEFNEFIRENKAKVLAREEESYYDDTASDDNFVKKVLCVLSQEGGQDHNFDYLYINEPDLPIKGFLLVDINGLKYQGQSLILAEDIDYIDEVQLEDFMPIFGKITNTPKVIQSNSIFEEYNDSHTTRLDVRSGNVDVVISPRMHIYCKKGMHIQFRGLEDKLIYCDEIIYQLQQKGDGEKMLEYIEGNDELLEEIFPALDIIFYKESTSIKKTLIEKARWGSLKIIIVKNANLTVGVGIAHVNNLNTGHIEYILVSEQEQTLVEDLREKLTAWLSWLRVKSITEEREVVRW